MDSAKPGLILTRARKALRVTGSTAQSRYILPVRRAVAVTSVPRFFEVRSHDDASLARNFSPAAFLDGRRGGAAVDCQSFLGLPGAAGEAWGGLPPGRGPRHRRARTAGSAVARARPADRHRQSPGRRLE